MNRLFLIPFAIMIFAYLLFNLKIKEFGLSKAKIYKVA